MGDRSIVVETFEETKPLFGFKRSIPLSAHEITEIMLVGSFSVDLNPVAGLCDEGGKFIL
jgi:hypothetical protein